MQVTKQAVWPTAPQMLTQLLCALAFIAFAAWSQPSHAGSLLLWSWLGVADIQIMQSGCPGTPKPSAAAKLQPESRPEKTPVADLVKVKPQAPKQG